MITANYIEDMGVYIVKLPKGDYLVSGEPVSIEAYSGKEIETQAINDIRKITVANVVVGHASDTDTLTPEQYADQVESKAVRDSDGYLDFPNIDDEYEYKKLAAKYETKVYRTIEQLSEPLSVSVNNGVIKTGSPFVSSQYALSGGSASMYVYNRKSLAVSTVESVLSGLGLTRADSGTDYKATLNDRSWAVSKTGSIRFSVAMGGFLTFLEKYEEWPSYRGDLDTCMSLASDDEAEITEKLKAMYAGTYTNSADGINGKRLLGDLKSICTLISEIQPVKKSYDKKTSAMRSANDALKYVESFLANSVDSNS